MKVATTFNCNFCKSDTHDKRNCLARLAQVCTALPLPGHLAPRSLSLALEIRRWQLKRAGAHLPNRPTNTSEAPDPNNNNNMNNTNTNTNAAAKESDITEEELVVIPPIGEEEEGEIVLYSRYVEVIH
ncbi:hypothetical protein BGZ83_010728 [Gryganskiella cystojenkinii]|nr:hypothetical protein BGZ83_010728 [Gryganskiella cystojenkinii]